jgi:hypothetical protein
MAHKFLVGQTVDLTPLKLRQAAAGEYEIRRLMPIPDDDAGNPCYRVKSIAENHERVVRENEILLSRRLHSVLSATARGQRWMRV